MDRPFLCLFQLGSFFFCPQLYRPRAPCTVLYSVPMRIGGLTGACNPMVCPIHVVKAFIPETKGKTMAMIQAELRGEKMSAYPNIQ